MYRIYILYRRCTYIICSSFYVCAEMLKGTKDSTKERKRTLSNLNFMAHGSYLASWRRAGQPIVVVWPDVLQVCIVWTKLSWVRLAENNSLLSLFLGRFLSYDLRLKRTLQSSTVHAAATGKSITLLIFLPFHLVQVYILLVIR